MRISDKKCKIVTLILFLFGVLFYFSIGNYLKTIFVYGDELRYFGIAQSLAFGKGITVYNNMYNDQKILYDMLLAPIFWIPSKLDRIMFFSLLNSVLVCSGVFPLYKLGKIILKNNYYIMLCIILYIFFPDLNFSQTFMSENLYLPLSLWGVLLYYKLLIKDYRFKYRIAIFIGIFTYFLYIIKEIGIIFIISLFISLIFDYFFINKSKKNTKKLFIQFLIINIVFIICYFIGEKIIFKGMESTYEIDNILFKKEAMQYVLYAFTVYTVNIIVSFLFFPFITPILKFKNLNDKQKKLFIQLFSLIFISIFVISYTWSYTENFGDEIPRTHLRYFGYLYIPTIMLFFSILDKRKNTIRYNVILFVFCTISIIFLKFPRNDSGLDHTVLNWLLIISKNLDSTKILLVLLVVLFIFIQTKYKTRLNSLYFLIFLILEIMSSCMSIKSNKRNRVELERVQEVLKIDNYIKENEDKNFLFLNKEFNENQRLMDTYVYNKNLYTMNSNTYYSIQKDNGIDLEKIKLTSMINEKKYNDLKTINYVIFPNKLGKKFKDEDIEYINNITLKNFTLIKLKNTRYIPKLVNNLIDLQSYSKGVIYENGTLNVPSNEYLYGPYITLPKGYYRIDFICKFQKDSEGEFIINSENGEIKRIKSNKDTTTIEFNLKNKTKNIEFVIYNKGNKNIIVKDLKLFPEIILNQN